MRKALIFNPYLDILGGGEFFSLLVAEFLLKQGFEVNIAWESTDILASINERFGINFAQKVNINKQLFILLNTKNNLLKKYVETKKYDLIFFVSDGSVPFLFGKQNWLLFQAPFINVGGRSFLNQIKLKNITKVICYSNFVKKFIDKEYGVQATVIYPTINPFFLDLKPCAKENIILSVGRFDQIMNAKKQDMLIRVFKKIVDNGLKDWRLVLLGGLKEKYDYFHKIKTMAEKYPIEIYSNCNFKTLVNYYQKSKIYWHATGFGEDLDIHPEKAEHFGISILEAMASKTIPLAFNGGGVPEILKFPEFLWFTEEELIAKTNLLIKNKMPQKLLLKKMQNCQNYFNQENFEGQLRRLYENTVS